ncbi:MAG: hypothetical protein QOJ23_3907 [Actinomycetota bacterium]|nr:hypothetical protein [Actinomycetota bacterium]
MLVPAPIVMATPDTSSASPSVDKRPPMNRSDQALMMPNSHAGTESTVRTTPCVAWAATQTSRSSIGRYAVFPVMEIDAR